MGFFPLRAHLSSGTWPAARVATVLQFPDMDRIKEWYSSAEYQEARTARHGAIELRMLFVEGKPA
ncbi:DUF1330 domain-containing protein [Streptomyces sp. H27-C3]|uniref:DUF1330 domain-containing protein n=1 Tax=Streptomyces sp. H27-C3 TaxID=3046305 RepID=UPI0024B929F4|nr:DUF1330 domain-containing protein [Streptomyces sp. H27-C3]MDJ0460109.1 DUF1330 domain-containing protein [Streptomyces sp. H27-C3]